MNLWVCVVRNEILFHPCLPVHNIIINSSSVWIHALPTKYVIPSSIICILHRCLNTCFVYKMVDLIILTECSTLFLKLGKMLQHTCQILRYYLKKRTLLFLGSIVIELTQYWANFLIISQIRGRLGGFYADYYNR